MLQALFLQVPPSFSQIARLQPALEGGRSQATLRDRGAAPAQHPHRCLAPERLIPGYREPPSVLSVGTRNTTEQSKQAIPFLHIQVSVMYGGCFSCVCICALCAFIASRVQKRALDALELELQTLVICHVGPGNRTQALYSSIQCSYPLSHLQPQHTFHILLMPV